VVAEKALAKLLEDGALRRRLGAAARSRVEGEFDYDLLATRLADALDACGG
jgi:glycosyltransferase involved in cell wall biosynthesis